MDYIYTLKRAITVLSNSHSNKADALEPHWRLLTKDYKLKSRLGVGSFGEVVRGKHRNTGETVAIKCIKLSQNELLYHKVIREVAIMR